MNRNKPENLKKASENFKKNHPELKSILFDNIHIDIIEKFSDKAKELNISKAQLFRDIVEKLWFCEWAWITRNHRVKNIRIKKSSKKRKVLKWQQQI